MIDWDTFVAKVCPALLTAFLSAVVVLAWGLAGLAVREVICPTPTWPAPPRCSPTNPH